MNKNNSKVWREGEFTRVLKDDVYRIAEDFLRRRI